MKYQLTSELRQQIVNMLAEIPRTKSVQAACSELSTKVRNTKVKVVTDDGSEKSVPLDYVVTDSDLRQIVEEHRKTPVRSSMPDVQHQVIENSELFDLLLLMKRPGARKAIEELAALHDKKEEAAKTCLDHFRSVGEMESGEIEMVIDGVLQEGICFIGATPASGKTLISLSFAKAISTRKPLFGMEKYAVKKRRQVIYLIPESGDHAFRKRCEAFRIPDEKRWFMARTISAGVPLELGDPILIEAVRQTKPVVFLDTASRFMKSNDENAAAQNRQLVNDVIALLAAGAVTVVLVHHATKNSRKEGAMTLENMLRGSSDLGAMCDQAYGIRKDETLYANGNGPMEIDMVNLKDREQIGGLTALRLAASYTTPGRIGVASYINEAGDFKVVEQGEMKQRLEDVLVQFVKDDPTVPEADIARELGLDKSGRTIGRMLNRLGWHRVKGGPEGASPWHNDQGKPCPYLKEQQDSKAAKGAKKNTAIEAKATKQVGKVEQATLTFRQEEPEHALER